MSFFPTANSIRDWCNQNDVPYLDGEKGQFVITKIFGREIPIRVIHHEARHMLTFAVRMPYKVPENRLVETGLAVNMVNGATFMGCWTIQSSLELFYRLTIPSTALVDEETIKFLLGVLLGSVDASALSLKGVVEGAEPSTVYPKNG